MPDCSITPFPDATYIQTKKNMLHKLATGFPAEEWVTLLQNKVALFPSTTAENACLWWRMWKSYFCGFCCITEQTKVFRRETRCSTFDQRGPLITNLTIGQNVHGSAKKYLSVNHAVDLTKSARAQWESFAGRSCSNLHNGQVVQFFSRALLLTHFISFFSSTVRHLYVKIVLPPDVFLLGRKVQSRTLWSHNVLFAIIFGCCCRDARRARLTDSSARNALALPFWPLFLLKWMDAKKFTLFEALVCHARALKKKKARPRFVSSSSPRLTVFFCWQQAQTSV